MKPRLGTQQASTATAHKLPCLIYTRLKHGTADVRPNLADDQQQYRNRMSQNLPRLAKALGYASIKTPEGTPA